MKLEKSKVVLANKIVREVEKGLKGKKIVIRFKDKQSGKILKYDFAPSLEMFSNGREQGYCISCGYDFGICFSESRNSDDIRVYKGKMDIDNKPETDEAWAPTYFSPVKDSYIKDAAKFIVNEILTYAENKKWNINRKMVYKNNYRRDIMSTEDVRNNITFEVSVGALLRGTFRKHLEKIKFDLEGYDPHCNIAIHESKYFLESNFSIRLKNIQYGYVSQVREWLNNLKGGN